MVKYIFIDRDGVINEDSHLPHKKEHIKLIEGSAKAIRLLNDNGYKVIIITNQAVVARGLCTLKECIEVGKYLNELLRKEGAIIERTYFCPHHPKKGDDPKYTRECLCRKPKPGMILAAKRDFRIGNLSECYMIGDRTGDILAGERAGCKTIMVKTGYGGDDGFDDATPDYVAESLLDAVDSIVLKPKKLFINAGGKGLRLMPLTKDIPKPMVEILGKPVLHHLVDWAKSQGINEIIMMNGYKYEKIVNYFGDGEKFGIKINHSNEPYPLDSGGPIKFASKYIDDVFFYVSGDHVSGIDLSKMYKFHKEKGADMTVLVHKSSHPDDSDLIKIDNNGKVIKFVSKHDDHTGAGDLSNAGLCIIEPKIVDLMDKEIFNFENYIYPKALRAGFKLYGYQSKEFFHDMGTLERLKECEEYLRGKNADYRTG